MPSDVVDAHVPDVSTRDTREPLAQIRRLVVTALVAGLGYSMLTVASRGQCLGGIGADGHVTDRLGNGTDVPPPCVMTTLHPSPVVYLALALVVVWAIGRVTTPEHDAASASRLLRRTSLGVVALAVVAVALTLASFMSIPLDRWDGTGTPPIPDWLDVDVAVTPMSAS